MREIFWTYYTSRLPTSSWLNCFTILTRVIRIVSSFVPLYFDPTDSLHFPITNLQSVAPRILLSVETPHELWELSSYIIKIIFWSSFRLSVPIDQPFWLGILYAFNRLDELIFILQYQILLRLKAVAVSLWPWCMHLSNQAWKVVPHNGWSGRCLQLVATRSYWKLLRQVCAHQDQ